MFAALRGIHPYLCTPVLPLFQVMWIQEGFTAEPPRNDSGANFHLNDSGFGPKVRVTGQKSGLQAKSQSYSRADPQNPNRIAQKRGPNGVQALLQKTPLKAFLNPDKPCESNWQVKFVSNIILANSELTTINRLQVRK